MRAASSTPSQMVRSTLYSAEPGPPGIHTPTLALWLRRRAACDDVVRGVHVCTSSNRTACMKKTTHPGHPAEESRLQDRLANLARERKLLRTRLIRVGLLLCPDEVVECVSEDEGNRFCNVGSAEGHGGDDGPEVLVGRGRGRGGGCGV